jgi:hypothetical protein
MRYLIIILVLFFSVAYGQDKKHIHTPTTEKNIRGHGEFDPLLYRDSTKIRKNVITYVLRNYQCSCKVWYKVRTNIDTFSTVRKAKYSNQKYKRQ